MLWWELRKFKSPNDTLVRCQAALSIGNAIAKSLAKSPMIKRGIRVEAINALINGLSDENEVVRIAAHKTLENLAAAIPVAHDCEDAAASKLRTVGGVKFFLRAYVEAIHQSGRKPGVDMLISESTLRLM